MASARRTGLVENLVRLLRESCVSIALLTGGAGCTHQLLTLDTLVRRNLVVHWQSDGVTLEEMTASKALEVLMMPRLHASRNTDFVRHANTTYSNVNTGRRYGMQSIDDRLETAKTKLHNLAQQDFAAASGLARLRWAHAIEFITSGRYICLQFVLRRKAAFRASTKVAPIASARFVRMLPKIRDVVVAEANRDAAREKLDRMAEKRLLNKVNGMQVMGRVIQVDEETLEELHQSPNLKQAIVHRLTHKEQTLLDQKIKELEEGSEAGYVVTHTHWWDTHHSRSHSNNNHNSSNNQNSRSHTPSTSLGAALKLVTAVAASRTNRNSIAAQLRAVRPYIKILERAKELGVDAVEVEQTGFANLQALAEGGAPPTCCICLMTIKDPVVTSCVHMACCDCILHWFNASATMGISAHVPSSVVKQVPCPLCRRPFTSSELIRIIPESEAPPEPTPAPPPAVSGHTQTSPTNEPRPRFVPASSSEQYLSFAPPLPLHSRSAQFPGLSRWLLTHLKQCSGVFAGKPKDKIDKTFYSAKVNQLLRDLSEIFTQNPDDKVVVFSSHRTAVLHVSEVLRQEGYSCVRIVKGDKQVTPTSTNK
eukprot:c19054_g2_i1.p1 GENE.c19054_g2_i1~~c19054_g2_i1.p1  ORF type:complete len:676 (+),score=160.91 c19054_g2_i1:250-2028(+)